MSQGKKIQLYNWDEMQTEELSPVIHRKMLWGERVMLSHVILKKGSELCLPIPTITSSSATSISGRMRFWVGEDERERIFIEAGEVLHLPSNIPHGAETLEDTVSLDVFSPPRQDWIDGDDAYLRDE